MSTNIFLIDGDTIEQKNCARQLFLKEEVGHYKANILAERYEGMYPHINLVPLSGFLSIKDMLKPFLDASVAEDFSYAVEAALGVTDPGMRPKGATNLSSFLYGPLFSTYLAALVKNTRLFMPEATQAQMMEHISDTLQRVFGPVLWETFMLKLVLLIHCIKSSPSEFVPPAGWKVSWDILKDNFPGEDLEVEAVPEWARNVFTLVREVLVRAALADQSQEHLLHFGLAQWVLRSYTETSGSIYDSILGEQESDDHWKFLFYLLGNMKNVFLDTHYKQAFHKGLTFSNYTMKFKKGHHDTTNEAWMWRNIGDSVLEAAPTGSGSSSSTDLSIVNVLDGVASPDIIILAVDSPNARKEVLALATLLTKDTYEDTNRKILVVDPGNEDTFGQVTVTTLGRKLPLPILPSFVPAEERLRFKEELPTVHYMPTVGRFIGGGTPDMGGQIKEFLSILPDRGFFTERLDFMPWTPFSFLLRKRSEVAVSCAGLDQTLAINNVMASMSVSALQNSLFQAPSTMETGRFSLVSSIHGQSTDIPWFRRRMGDGAIEDTSVAYLGEDVDHLVLVYRFGGEEYVDVYNKMTMECLRTNADKPMFQQILETMYDSTESLSVADRVRAKIVMVSLIAGKPYPMSINTYSGASDKQQCGVVPLQLSNVPCTMLMGHKDMLDDRASVPHNSMEVSMEDLSNLVLYIGGVLSSPWGYSQSLTDKVLNSLRVKKLYYSGAVQTILENAQYILPVTPLPYPMYEQTGAMSELVSNTSLAIAFSRLNTLSLLETIRSKGGLWKEAEARNKSGRDSNWVQFQECINDASVAALTSHVINLASSASPTNNLSTSQARGVVDKVPSLRDYRVHASLYTGNMTTGTSRHINTKSLKKVLSVANPRLRQLFVECYGEASEYSPFGTSNGRIPKRPLPLRLADSGYPTSYRSDTDGLATPYVIARTALRLSDLIILERFTESELLRLASTEVVYNFLVSKEGGTSAERPVRTFTNHGAAQRCIEEAVQQSRNSTTYIWVDHVVDPKCKVEVKPEEEPAGKESAGVV